MLVINKYKNGTVRYPQKCWCFPLLWFVSYECINLFYFLSFQPEICANSLVDIIQAVVNGADGCLFCYGHARLGKYYRHF